MTILESISKSNIKVEKKTSKSFDELSVNEKVSYWATAGEKGKKLRETLVNALVVDKVNMQDLTTIVSEALLIAESAAEENY